MTPDRYSTTEAGAAAYERAHTLDADTPGVDDIAIDCAICGEALTDTTYCAADDHHHPDCGDQCPACMDEAAREYADEQRHDYEMYGPI